MQYIYIYVHVYIAEPHSNEIRCIFFPAAVEYWKFSLSEKLFIERQTTYDMYSA